VTLLFREPFHHDKHDIGSGDEDRNSVFARCLGPAIVRLVIDSTSGSG